MEVSLNTTNGNVSSFVVAFNYSVLVILDLPSFLLCVLVIAALLLDRQITWKVKVPLIGIFISSLCESFSSVFTNIGYAQRVVTGSEITCIIGYVILSFGAYGDLITIVQYVVSVYIVIKYGKKKLKWNAIILYVVISWAANIALSASFQVIVVEPPTNGFCINTVMFMSPLVYFHFSIQVTSRGISYLIVIVTSILTFYYVRVTLMQ